MDLIGNRMAGYLMTYNYDFTAYKNDLQVDPKTGRWANFDKVMTIGAKAGLPFWGNSGVVDLPTSAVPEANQNFQRVLVQQYPSGPVMGPIYFHYDLNW
ncbi:hypothetical protein D3C81_2075120 [compost metagenome]